jgi:putative ABC transport system permease protein
LIGIAIGAAVLLGMITLCYDVPRQLSQEFRSYGANMIFMPAGRETSLLIADVKRALALLPAEKVLGATMYRYASARINLQPLTAAGTDFTQAAKTSPFWKIDGQFPSHDNEILIGADVAELTKLTPGMSALVSGRGKNRTGFNRPMLVSGIISSGGVEDGFIFMNMSAMESLQGNSGEADMVELSLTANAEELGNIAALINNSIKNIKAHLVQRITQSEANVLSKLESLVYLVTVVVLLLTMICVATTMMTIVMERRKEIGLKKAIGADSKNVGKEFLLEGLIMGVAGGLIGSVCGLIFAQIISDSVFARSINIEIYLIPVTLIISGIVTVLACLVPARRAMDVEPSVVLRGE